MQQEEASPKKIGQIGPMIVFFVPEPDFATGSSRLDSSFVCCPRPSRRTRSRSNRSTSDQGQNDDDGSFFEAAQKNEFSKTTENFFAQEQIFQKIKFNEVSIIST